MYIYASIDVFLYIYLSLRVCVWRFLPGTDQNGTTLYAEKGRREVNEKKG